MNLKHEEVRGGMLSVAQEAMAMVPECSDWTLEHEFSATDRLQMGPPVHSVLVKSSDTRFVGGVMLFMDDVVKGAPHIAYLLRKRLESMSLELKRAGLT